MIRLKYLNFLLEYTEKKSKTETSTLLSESAGCPSKLAIFQWVF